MISITNCVVKLCSFVCHFQDDSAFRSTMTVIYQKTKTKTVTFWKNNEIKSAFIFNSKGAVKEGLFDLHKQSLDNDLTSDKMKHWDDD